MKFEIGDIFANLGISKDRVFFDLAFSSVRYIETSRPSIDRHIKISISGNIEHEEDAFDHFITGINWTSGFMNLHIPGDIEGKPE